MLMPNRRTYPRGDHCLYVTPGTTLRENSVQLTPKTLQPTNRDNQSNLNQNTAPSVKLSQKIDIYFTKFATD